MKPENAHLLLSEARQSVREALSGRRHAPCETEETELLAERGCFVTLKTAGALRGCLGRFISDMPLIDTVCLMAAESATEDPRFFTNPISPDEVSELEIEISVLSELTDTEDPASLRPGIDGIYITRGYRSGCFLPQVLTEAGWSVEEFLSYCCTHKAGLPASAWKDPETRVQLFTCEIIKG